MKRHLIAFPMLALLSASALAWSDDGHEIIAKHAYEQLTPTSKQWVNSVLTGGDYSEDFITGATWAKRAKDARFFQHLYRYEQLTGKECVDNCLITRASTAINTLQTATFNDAGQTPSYQEQQQALMEMMYYVSEIHQPLNAGLAHNGYGRQIGDLHYQGVTHNLYDWWEIEFVKGIEASMPPAPATPAQVIDRPPHLSRWLQDSEQLALNTAYGPRPRTNLSSTYVKMAKSTVAQQFALASTRLAQIINQLPATQLKPAQTDTPVSS